MADFKSYKEFKNAFEEKAKKSLNTNVKDFVTGEIQKRIRHDVYNVYEPTAYNRTEGLFDLSNYHYTLSGNTDNELQLSVEHRALTSEGRNLSKLIILGQVRARAYGENIAQYNDTWIMYTQWRYRKYGKLPNETPFYEPRNFIANAKQVLSFDRNKEKMINEFKKGMR